MPLIFSYVAVLFLFLLVAPLPYMYYKALKLVIFAVFAGCAYTAIKRRIAFLSIAFLILAFVYNPFWEFYFHDLIWDLINIGTALFFLESMDVVKPIKKVKKKKHVPAVTPASSEQTPNESDNSEKKPEEGEKPKEGDENPEQKTASATPSEASPGNAQTNQAEKPAQAANQTSNK